MATLKRLKNGDHEIVGNGPISHKWLMEYASRCMDEKLRDPIIISSTLKPVAWTSSSDPLPSKVDEEVRRRTKQMMDEHGFNYGRALRKVLAADEKLAQRYRAAHTKELL